MSITRIHLLARLLLYCVATCVRISYLMPPMDSPTLCTPPNPPIEPETDCFHAVDLMSNTPNPMLPAAFRHGHCLLFLRGLYVDKVDHRVAARFLYLPTPPPSLPRATSSLLSDAVRLQVRDKAVQVLRQCLPKRQLGLVVLWTNSYPSSYPYIQIAFDVAPKHWKSDTSYRTVYLSFVEKLHLYNAPVDSSSSTPSSSPGPVQSCESEVNDVASDINRPEHECTTAAAGSSRTSTPGLSMKIPTTLDLIMRDKGA